MIDKSVEVKSNRVSYTYIFIHEATHHPSELVVARGGKGTMSFGINPVSTVICGGRKRSTYRKFSKSIITCGIPDQTSTHRDALRISNSTTAIRATTWVFMADALETLLLFTPKFACMWARRYSKIADFLSEASGAECPAQLARGPEMVLPSSKGSAHVTSVPTSPQ